MGNPARIIFRGGIEREVETENDPLDSSLSVTVSDSDEWHYHNHKPINHIEYKNFVEDWINKGASVIGGCCRTTTDHIKEIKKILSK